jgi:hypothetical protein
MSTGYSGTSLGRKLGLKEGMSVFLSGQPDNYFELFTDLPDQLKVVKRFKPESLDFIHIFCANFSELVKKVDRCKKGMKKNGQCWVSWPKGSSGISTDLKRDLIREYMIEEGLVDVKIASIDENWSGLKFVYRLKDR